MHLLRYNDIVGSFRKDFPGARSALVTSTHKIRHPRWMSSALQPGPLCNVVYVELYLQRSWTAIFCQSTRVRPVRKCIIRSRGSDVPWLRCTSRTRISNGICFVMNKTTAANPLWRTVSTPKIFIFYVTFGSSQSTTLTYKILRVPCVNKISWILARFCK